MRLKVSGQIIVAATLVVAQGGDKPRRYRVLPDLKIKSH
jgi:hypothetical protein